MSQYISEVVAQILKIKTRLKAVKIIKIKTILTNYKKLENHLVKVDVKASV